MKKTILLFCILHLAIAFNATAIHANEETGDEAIAKLTRVMGNVFIEKSDTGKKITASENMKVYAEDIIITEGTGKCVIYYFDKSTIQVASDSKIKIDDISDDEEDNKSITCFIGQIFAKIIKRSDQSFEINTPTAVIGVRGTEFMVAAGDDGSSLIGVENGSIEIENADGKKIEIAGGEEVEISYKAKMRKRRGFKYNNFRRKEWQAKRRKFLKENKDQILEHLNNRFELFEKKFKQNRKNLIKLRKQRKELVMGVKKAKKRKARKKIKYLSGKLKQNFKQTFIIVGKTQKMNNRFLCHIQTLDRFKKLPGYDKFVKKHKNLFDKIEKRNKALQKNIKKHRKNRQEMKKQYKENFKKKKALKQDKSLKQKKKNKQKPKQKPRKKRR